MMRILPVFVLIAVLASSFPVATAAKGTNGSAADDAAIRALLETFRVGVIARDKAALNRLPVSPDITFIASIDPETLARLRIRRADAKRLVPGTYPGFVDDIVSSKTRSEEVFDNVVIQNDGSIGTIYFSYKFKEDDIVSNWGHESWGLVATEDGWKISSIIYSLTFSPPPPLKH